MTSSYPCILTYSLGVPYSQATLSVHWNGCSITLMTLVKMVLPLPRAHPLLRYPWAHSHSRSFQAESLHLTQGTLGPLWSLRCPDPG